MANGDFRASSEFYGSHIDDDGRKIQDVAAFIGHIDEVIDNYRAGLLSHLDLHIKAHASHSKGELLFEVPQSRLIFELEHRGMYFDESLKRQMSCKKRFRFAVLVREEGQFYPSRDFLRFTMVNHLSDPTVRIYLMDKNVDIDQPLEPKKTEPSYEKIMDAFKFELNEAKPIPSLISAWSKMGESIYKRQVSLEVIRAKIITRLLMNELFYKGFDDPHAFLASCADYVRNEKDPNRAERTNKMLQSVFTDVLCCKHRSSNARRGILKMIENRCNAESLKNPASPASVFLKALLAHLKGASKCEHDEAPFRLSSKVAKYLLLAKEKFPLSRINRAPMPVFGIDTGRIIRH